MVPGAYLATALVVGAASAFILLRDRDHAASKVALRMAVGMFALVAPLQLMIGDAAGKQILHTQPGKLTAIEAIRETKPGQAFHLAAWPDRRVAGNRWEISIPKLGSLITAGDANASITGLKAPAAATSTTACLGSRWPARSPPRSPLAPRSNSRASGGFHAPATAM